MNRRLFLKTSVISILGASTIAFTYGSYTGSNIERIEINWDLGSKIVFMSDLHIHGFTEKIASIEQKEKPDIILIGGDTYDHRTKTLKDISDSFSIVETRVIAVLGNHEHWCETRYNKFKIEQGINALEKSGVTVLRDEVIKIGHIKIQGLDWKENYDYRDIDSNNDLTIVHTPDAFVFINSARVLAGHTHGGQVCLPGGDSLYTNSHEGFHYGLYTITNRELFVSKGMGELLPPRLFCRKDYVVIY